MNTTPEGQDPQETVRVNISITRGTQEILKDLAKHQHLNSSAVITCLIRRKAEEVGLLPHSVDPRNFVTSDPDDQ